MTRSPQRQKQAWRAEPQQAKQLKGTPRGSRRARWRSGIYAWSRIDGEHKSLSISDRSPLIRRPGELELIEPQWRITISRTLAGSDQRDERWPLRETNMPLNKLRKLENWLALGEEVRARSRRRRKRRRAEALRHMTKSERQEEKVERRRHEEARRELRARLKSLTERARLFLGLRKLNRHYK